MDLHLSNLPRSPHFVAKCPVLHLIRYFMAILSPQVGVVGVAGAVTVLQPAESLVQSSSAEIKAQIWLCAKLSTPPHEFIRAKGVGFVVSPGQFWTGRSLVAWSNAVEPMVSGAEVAAWVTDHGDVEWLESIKDVETPAMLVDEVLVGVRWIVDAAINAAAHVFGEAGVDIAVDL